MKSLNHLMSFTEFLNSDLYCTGYSEFVNEARSHPELNPKVSMMQALEPYKDKDGYYITFTDERIVSLYPKNEYGTPYGIYCYPLKQIWKDVAQNSVPFASRRPFVSLLHMKQGRGKMLDYTTATDEEVKRCHKILVKKYGLPTDINLASKDAKYGMPKNNFQTIWQLSRNAAIKGVGRDINIPVNIDQKDPKLTMKWNYVLRKDLGYIGVQDLKGDKVIHPNEPIQAVFLSGAEVDFTVVKMIINKRYNDDIYFNSGEKGMGSTGISTTSQNGVKLIDQAMDAIRKSCKKWLVGNNSMFVPANIESIQNMAVVENGKTRTISNFGIERLACTVDNGILNFNNCTFTDTLSVKNKMSKGVTFDKCLISDTYHAKRTENCIFTRCTFGITDVASLGDVITLIENGNTINIDGCKICIIDPTKNSPTIGSRRELIDCDALIKRNPVYANLASNPLKFFTHLEMDVKNKILSGKSRLLTQSAMDVLSIDDTQANVNAYANIYDRVRNELQNYGEFGITDSDMFVPHGSSENKISVKSGKSITVSNIGLEDGTLIANTLGSVILKKCVITGMSSKYANVIFDDCVFVEPNWMKFTNCEFKKYALYCNSRIALHQTGGVLESGCKCSAKDMNLYMNSAADEEDPQFNPDLCRVHLTYKDVVNACPSLKSASSNGGKFIDELADAIDRKYTEDDSEMFDSEKTTDWYLDLLSREDNDSSYDTLTFSF